MRPEDFERLASLFEEARGQHGSVRRAFLDAETEGAPELRAEVERLLALHETDDRALGEFGQAARAVLEELADGDQTPEQVGPYRILGELGVGGMGVVYLAEQESPLRRQVALKILRPGMNSRDIVERFDRERQTLARLVHPEIAQVYDAGTTPDGRPFFALEYVDGVAITDYCDTRRLRPSERIVLFRKVCRAVEHAHQKGIIHRDLKPSNVLVTEVGGVPVPKVIDFGIARATDEAESGRTLLTQHGHLIGTPAYMSPEQATQGSGDLDTRTDVYSLGVILYQLLVGALPFDADTLRRAGVLEIHRILAEEEPDRPSVRLRRLGEQSTTEAALRRSDPPSLIRRLQGDLDWITMKALEKDRTRRYASVGALASDLERFLSNEVVEARPPSVGYRLAKFVRRHRVPVLAASLLLLTLVGGLFASTSLYLRAERERRLAEVRLATVERRADLQVTADLVAEAETLWPMHPARAEAMRSWIARAEEVLSRLPRYRARRDALRVRGNEHEGGGEVGLREELELLRKEYRAKRRDLGKYFPVTLMPEDDAARGPPRTAYFRHAFDVPETLPAGALSYRIHVIDGAVLYLNGEEVDRWNLPAGELAHDTPATEPYSLWPARGEIPSEKLRPGRNVFAVEVHRAPKNGSRIQLVFDATGPDGRVLVESDAAWTYAPAGSVPAPAWKEVGFASVWAGGPASIGYAVRDSLSKEHVPRIEYMRGELARLETAMQPLVAKLAQRSRWVLPLAQDQMEHDELDQLVVALADLARGDPPGLLADVERRLAEADTLRARTVDAHEETWRRAAAALHASPAYAGLDLRPQVGLVPLGADPRSGLHEFAHLQTGAIPARASDGDLRIDDATGVVLVLVPSGSFAMGAVRPSPGFPKGAPNADAMALRGEGPVHRVTLSPFFLSKYEMTQGQWLRLTGENPSTWPVGSHAQGRQVTLLNPVEGISWDPCRQVLRRVGLTLPTEAQWEYATRAGTTTPWWTGEMPREVKGALNIADLAAMRNGEAWASKAWDELDDGYVVHAPCGTFPPNPWGFHETLGNVREWTLDRFGFYEAPVRPEDGLRLEFFDPELIITRGSSYSGRLPTSRVSHRGSTKAQLAETWVGVRPARALDR